MKIACQSCGAKYTIADEKVSGKTVKIKCKKCGATVVVDGHAHGDAPGGGEAMGAGAGPDEWTVSVADDDQRSLTTAQIVEEFQNGVVTPDTFVWREGMAEWQALAEVPDLAASCGLAVGGAPEPATQAMGSPSGGGGLFGGAAPVAAAAIAASPAAARTKGRAQVDLFGAGAAPAQEAPGAGSAHIGERNENSVLFSLSALTAAETAAKKAPGKAKTNLDFGGGGSGGGGGAKASSIDDIMNLGSGSMNSGGSLAPPPMNAPFVEPPPPPPSYQAPAMAMGPASMPSGAMGGMPMSMPMDQPKKPPVGLIVGGILGVCVLAGGAFFLGRGGSDDDKGALAKTDTTAKPASEEPKKKDEPVAAETAKPTDTAAPADTGTSPDGKQAAGSPTAASTGAADPTANKGTSTAAPPPTTGAKKDDPKKDEPKKDEPKKDEPAAGGTGSFDRGAAQAALGSAAGGAKGCKKPDGPTGSTKVQVTFAPSGRVTTVNVGPPFAGTPVGSCIAGAFKGASVPPFSGSPVTVSKSVSIK